MEENSILDVSEYQKFITNYKAIYQAMTAKHDCKSKIFPRVVKVTFDDVCDLNSRVAEKLENYNIIGFMTSVTASFWGRRTIEFSSWSEFEGHKWNESDALTAITIVWEFNVLLPKYEIPQKHVLVVKITDGLRPEEILNIVFAGKLENMDDIEQQICPVVARVDFINYVLGDELLGIVEEWNRGLATQNKEESKPLLLVKRHRRKLAFLLNYITLSVFLFCSIRLFNYEVKLFGANKIAELSMDNMNSIVWMLGIIVLSFIVVNKISEWLANMFYKALGEQLEAHIFEINKGDMNMQRNLQQQNRVKIRSVFVSLFGTILLNIFCNLISTVIIK